MVRLAATVVPCLGCYPTATVPTNAIPPSTGSGVVPPDAPDSGPRFPNVPPSATRLPGRPPTRFEPVPEFVTAPSADWTPNAPAREWKYVVLHHTATDRGSVESIHEAHLRRKDSKGRPWQGIGYHFVIGNGQGMPDGVVEPTFRWREQMHGAHAGSNEHNQKGVGIVLVGNFEEHSPSPAQVRALRRLVAHLKTTYRIETGNVIAHSDVKATACPGKLFPLDEVALGPLDDMLRLAGTAPFDRSPATASQERRPR